MAIKYLKLAGENALLCLLYLSVDNRSQKCKSVDQLLLQERMPTRSSSSCPPTVLPVSHSRCVTINWFLQFCHIFAISTERSISWNEFYQSPTPPKEPLVVKIDQWLKMMVLQPAPGDTGKPCGIDYEMKVRPSFDFFIKSVFILHVLDSNTTWILLG